MIVFVVQIILMINNGKLLVIIVLLLFKKLFNIKFSVLACTVAGSRKSVFFGGKRENIEACFRYCKIFVSVYLAVIACGVPGICSPAEHSGD